MARLSIVCLTLWIAVPAQAQTPDAAAPKAFEVASIRLTHPDFTGTLIQTPGPGRIVFRGVTLTDLIGFAFDTDKRLIAGVPSTLDTTRYDIVGQSGQIGSPTATFASADVRLMMQALLAERFQLIWHRETRDVPVYGLHVVERGHKLRARREGDGGAPLSMLFQGANLPGRNVPISLFADGLQRAVLDRPVVDKTGLQGTFDFDLSWRPDASQFGGRGGALPAATDPDRADIFTALQEQLGLKLQPEKAPVSIIVVDAAQKPSEN